MMETSTSRLEIPMKGRIDSTNASQIEKIILDQLKGHENISLVLNAENLEYISSAGLRVILHLIQLCKDVIITNTRQEIYDIFTMTGFTEMLTVQKEYRVVSIDHCEEIGHGANGTIYRIDQDNVVKVYNNPSALEDIQHEQEVAKQALILGIPTAISYDVVKVGNSYGSVFEMLNAKSFSRILSEEPEKMDWCVQEFVRLLKKIHSTLVPENRLPDMLEAAQNWVEFMRDYLPEDSWKKLYALMLDIPQDNHMIHGDYQTNNVVLQGDEVLLIDMDTLAVGHPIFDLAGMFNSFRTVVST